MGDEPRRSVRATKGHHSKMDLDEAPIEPKKKSVKKGAKKAVEQEEEDGEEEELIRCVCGALSTDNGNEDGAWIACDECNVWQHNTCMDISPFDDEIPKVYLCEEHDPVFHKELLDAMAKGYAIWEDRKKKWAKKLKEKAAVDNSKKGGKKTKGGKRISEANGNSNPPSKVSTPVPESKKATPAKSNAKRKDRHDTGGKDTPKEPLPKIRKVTAPAVQSPPQKTPPSNFPVKIIDLEQSRQGAATLIKKPLDNSISIAAKNGLFKLAPDDTIDAKAERLAIRIEDAIYKTHPDKSAYGKQSRSISSNLKQNQELTIKLLNKTMSASEFAVMSTDDMASSQLKKETAKMKALSDKQSILLAEEGGPRIRKTHKGEEVVEGADYSGINESTMSSSRRRSMLDPNADMAVRSRENSPGEDLALEYVDDTDGGGRQLHPQQPLNVDTQRQPARKQSSHADFDINKVFSSVQSPTGPPAHVRRQSGHVVPTHATGNDPDIDKLLQDDGIESPPYSPAEYGSADSEIIWRGNMIMDSIATFSGSAKHVAGADLPSCTRMRWSDILYKELRIAGRISQEKANEYLCSLRYSPPTDVVVVDVTPAGEVDSAGFKEMFNYFHTKKRYGVLTNKGIGNIRDTYLVPIGANDPLPDFVNNLEGHRVPEVRTENLLLIGLVIRNEWVPPASDATLPTNPINYEAGAPGAGPTSPSVPTLPAMRNPSLSAPGPAMSPITGQSPFQPSTNSTANNVPAAPSVPALPATQPPPAQPQLSPDELATQQRTGEEVARQILGEFADSPTIGFLMPQAYQMRPLEWNIIKGILQRDERARTDLTHLSQVLNFTMTQENEMAQRAHELQLQQPNPFPS